MKKLYEIEYEYYKIHDRAIYIAEEGCTLEEFLKLGFNNATLLNPYEEDTDIFDLYIDSDIVDKLTNDMLKVRVKTSSLYEDGDGYTCANIVLENKKDWEYFRGLNYE